MECCQSYDKCIHNTKKTIRYPVDKRSLYRDRIYDNQTSNKLCYQAHPLEVIEGFNGNIEWMVLLKWALIILVIYYIFTLVTQPKTDEFGLPKSIGGLISSIDTYSFLNT